ncbi:nSTAND1 domain-containing NTPase [Aureibacter tunicatorum]|uniref:WD40 repeat protein n=1 Tax=Aureibacter tunicatorum TaxID=866807 RepID=A0AAE3XGY3_9BACT|nr:hypothetical protein [Aureibacter tunicatorum]MDR6237426.1 WD40 repeat protein [Aureibacter tunicatorum]BDD06416.1 hypothetical protein AUTU_38990 [Aureibacter tunicatorum]
MSENTLEQTIEHGNSSKKSSQNPFIGLRHFEEHEKHLYFGREEQVNEVLQKLMTYRFVSVIGVSGIGKSSFLYCGLEPAVLKTQTSFAKNWEVIKMRPSDQPKENFIKALESFIDSKGLEEERRSELLRYCKTEIFHGDDAGIKNVSHKLNDEFGANILLIIDQFEELFRILDHYEDERKSVQSEQFVDMLVRSLNDRETPLFVSIGIRSDFIGECARYPYLAKHINNSQFLIPQLTEDQLVKVIKGPLAMAQTNITDGLVSQIINDLKDQSDQLPIMQHALMRTWEYWKKNDVSGNPMDVHHYQAIGTMKEALSKHAQEAFMELNEEQRKVCERLFKSITEKKTDGRGIRKPATIDEIAQIAHTTPERVMEVVECFRMPGRTLLMPPSNVPLTNDTIVDISHESIMRIWDLLKTWVEEESESVKLYLRLSEAASMHQAGMASLWRPPDLDIATSWRKTEQPTLVWASRYDVAYERAMLFLEYSEKEFIKEQKRKEVLQKRRLFIARITASVLGFGIIVALLFLFYGEQKRREANRQKAIAEVQKQKADENSKLAQIESEKAQRSAEEAVVQSNRAQKSANEAKKSLKFALQQQVIAESKEKEAKQQKEYAEVAQQQAEIARSQAYNLRLLSIGKSMAIKSQQVDNPELQALLARQGFNFYDENGGNPQDPDLYNALYYGIKNNEEEDYNTLQYHSQNVRSIVSNTLNNKTYSAGSDGRIIEWSGDLNKHNVNIIFNDPSLIHKSISLDAENELLVAGGDYPYVLVIDLKNPDNNLKYISLDAEELWKLGFIDNGESIVAIGAQGSVFRFDLNSSEGKFELEDNVDGKINALAIHPSRNEFLLGMSDGTLKKFKNGTESKVGVKGNGAIISLAYHPNGEEIAIGFESGVVEIFDLKKRSHKNYLKGHTARINNLSFRHDGRQLASGSFDKTVRLWDLFRPDDQPIVLSDHYDWVWSIAYSADSEYLLAGCRDNIIRLWPVKVDHMAERLCGKITRKMSDVEWGQYVGKDIPLESTCK